MAVSLPRNCSCEQSEFRSISDAEELQDLLPPEYHYNLCHFLKSGDGFAAKIRINLRTKEDALEWLDKFSFSSNTTFRVDRVFPQNTVGNVYKISKFCHHKCRYAEKNNAGRKSKNTNCPAKLIMTVKQTSLCKRYKSVDVHLTDFPAVFVLHHIHNHPISSAEALKYRNPVDDVKDKYMNMFLAGYSPSQAYHLYTSDLQEQYQQDYFLISADGAYNPDMQWVYYTYYKVFRKEYGKFSASNVSESLNSFVLNYNQQQGGNFAVFEKTDDDNFIVVIVTPLMHRIINFIPQASEVLFCDSTGSVDRFGTKTYLMFTNSCCGGLPVCFVITSSEKEKEFVSALKVFQSLLKDESFEGRGKLGPKVIMTDDDIVERNAFSKVFPNSVILLCTFHILQACWRYLCNAESCVRKEYRQDIFFLVKKMVYAKNLPEFEQNFKTTVEALPVRDNPKVSNYIHKLYIRREEWALFYRQNLIIRGQNTNNICEAGVRVLKDRILQRKKAYSSTHLLDFLVSDLNNFYMRKISNIANGCPPPYLEKKNTIPDIILKTMLVEKLSNGMFEVTDTSIKKSYNVDASVGLCSCYRGRSGAICKHQIKVNIDFNINSSLLFPANAEEKKKLLFISSGNEDIPTEWFAPLHTKSDLEKTASHVEKPQFTPSGKPGTSKETFEFSEVEQTGIDEINTTPTNGQSAPNLKLDLQLCFEDLLKKSENNPEIQSALGKFIKNYRNIKTETGLKSALITFGKYPALAVRKKICSSKYIGVQPTAIARRKARCGGRAALQPGRPSKLSRVPEHGYGKSTKSTLLPKKKSRLAAPHCIAKCVDENVTLGKKH